MIDIATVEEYMRAANPIPTLDAVDADELASAVAATHMRRVAVLQAATRHPTESEATPATTPSRRRSVWAFAAAFVLILVVVGAAALLLRSDDPQVTDEPASSTTVLETPTSVVETPTTLAEAAPSTVAFDDTGRWQATKLSEPWTGDIVDVASLPSGGFVVAARSGVFWSPDGVEWIDAGPQQQITVTTADSVSYDVYPPLNGDGGHLPAVISVMGDRVVVLDGIESGLWVGNPKAAEWELIRLDTADLAGQVEPFAVASNDTEVLVLAKSSYAYRGYLVWLVKPQTGDVEWRFLPSTRPDPEKGGMGISGAVAWVNDRWVIALDDMILVSGDGVTWTQVPGEDTFDDPLWVNALTAGPAGVIATTCGGWGPHDVYFSEDGLNWENTYVDNFHVEPAYADGLGFVVVDGSEEGGHRVTGSPDGRTWHATTWHSGGSVPSWALADDGALENFEIRNLAASGQTVFVGHTEGALLLTYD